MQKKKEVKDFFESKRYVSLNEQVQTCKFAKKETSKTGVLTCQNLHNPVTHSCPEARADGEGLQSCSHQL